VAPLNLGVTGADAGRRAHLRQDFVQPLQWSVQGNVNPAWRVLNVGALIKRTSPAFHETDTNVAIGDQFIDSFEAVIDAAESEKHKFNFQAFREFGEKISFLPVLRKKNPKNPRFFPSLNHFFPTDVKKSKTAN
jgi:hypothetical protein